MNKDLYHLIVFLACLASLTLLVLTGHDSSPLLQSILGGAGAASGSNVLGALLGAGSGGGNQSGRAMPELLAALLVLTLAVVAGCAALQTDKVATSCATASAAIKTLAAARTQGLLSAPEQTLVDQSIAVVTPICTAGAEPSPTTAVTSALTSATALLTQSAANHPAPH